MITNSTTTAVWRRVGESLEMNVNTTFTAAPAVGAPFYIWNLPSGVFMEDSKLGAGNILGTMSATDGSHQLICKGRRV